MAWWDAHELEHNPKFYKKTKKLDDQLSKENLGFTKKEILKFGKERKTGSLGGISEMKKTPDLIFIIDTNVESCSGRSKKIRYTNYCCFRYKFRSNWNRFSYPGNDDARRSINLYCELLKNTIKDAEKFIKGSDKKHEENFKKREINLNYLQMSNKDLLENIKKLRDDRSRFKDCKVALDEAKGDIEKSVEFLRKKE